MKLALFSAPFALIALSTLPLSSAALADHHGSAAHSAEPAAAKLSLDTPIEVLLADERAKAIVEAQIPGIDQHPAYGQFKALSLKTVQPFSQGLITDEMLAKIAEGLAALS
jgi:hypothetical protein